MTTTDTHVESELWRLLTKAHKRAHWARGAERPVALAQRDAFLVAYTLVTGADEEGVYEELTEAMVAEHERGVTYR